MNTDYSIHSKVLWQIPLTKRWDETFYPQLVKKILKSDQHFIDHFSIQIHPLSKKNLHNEFLPLYMQQVAQRPDYTSDTDSMINGFFENMQHNVNYYHFAFYERSTKSYAGGIIFSVWPESIKVALRVFNRVISKKYHHHTTLDYWAEKVLFEHVQSFHRPILLHGRDNYPRKSSMTGLALFKLYLGASPTVSKTTQLDTYTNHTLQEMNVPIIFFDNPDANGYFKTLHFFNKQESSTQLIESLCAVTQWKSIELIIHEA